MTHVDSHQSCCFRTEATGAKRNTLISVFQGQSHLIDREIALRSYQHGDVIGTLLGCSGRIISWA